MPSHQSQPPSPSPTQPPDFPSHLPPTFPLPLCFPRHLAEGLVRSLVRPEPDAPAASGYDTVFEAVGMVALYAPRDMIEARLVQQIVVAHVRASLASEMGAALQATPGAMQRYERHGNAQQRAALRLTRALREHRREQGTVAGEHATWACDLVVMEAVWRGVKVPVVEPEGMAAKPAPARVPLWKQRKRQWMHEILDEELDELTAARERGEPLEEPPYKPGDPVLTWVPSNQPKLPWKHWKDMSMQERRERWGYRTGEEIAADKAAAAAAEAQAGAQAGGVQGGGAQAAE